MIKNGYGNNRSVRLIKSKQECAHCDIAELCIAVGMDEDRAEEMNNIVKTIGPIKRDTHVYRQGDLFNSLYAIQTGAVKSESVTREGRSHVTGFFFPGDLVGVDAFATGRYPSTITALESTWLCELPYTDLERLCSEFPGLQHEFIARLGNRIYKDEYDCLLNRGEPADKRVMSFLYSTHEKLNQATGNDSYRFNLPMTKLDAASYLGLTPESLSRSLKRLQNQGLIKNSPRSIELLNLTAIRKAITN